MDNIRDIDRHFMLLFKDMEHPTVKNGEPNYVCYI